MGIQPAFRGFAVLLACTLLGACANTLPQPPANRAFVSLDSSAPVDNVLAEKVDGHKVADDRYFALRPGSHDLQVLIEQEGYANADQNCIAGIHYSDFKAGHRYTLKEISHGPNVDAVLINQQGKTVGRAVDMDCMAG
ncbi:MAG: hypothetical protein GAK45_01155 [Pseudomonas citronellolis]|nr:MAG: hypothetical protein GAK45_01155 [Pseudomonas citronellolis]